MLAGTDFEGSAMWTACINACDSAGNNGSTTVCDNSIAVIDLLAWNYGEKLLAGLGQD
ncbi:MAG: hypothetical protein IPJ43_16660 [Saprospiraceae bacterium]|nr:hypothetical protein [Saprospiraceae bacterium]